MRIIKYSLILLAIIIVVFWIFTSYLLKRGEVPTADGSTNYAIVLGAKVNKGAVPSKALKYRLDAAYDYAVKYPHTQLILSGGQGDDEDATESSVMKKYLMDRGLSEFQLIEENKSTSTFTNIKYSMKSIPLTEKKVTIISNDFHLARAQMIAHYFHLEADVVAAPTPKIIEFKVRLRERFGLIAQKIVLWLK